MSKPLSSFLSLLASVILLNSCEKLSTLNLSGSSESSPAAAVEPFTHPAQCELSGVNNPVRSAYKIGEVAMLCDKAIARVDTRLQEIVATPEKIQSIDNTLIAFETAMADFSDEVTPLTFTGYTSTDEKVSAEGSECEQKVGQYSVDVFTRRGLYKALAAQSTSDDAKARLLSQTLLSFEQNGLKLDDATLAKVKLLKGELSTKESQFTTNLNSDKSSLSFTADELNGATVDFLARLKKSDDGKYIVTTKSTDYSDLMQNVSVANTRKQMMLAYLNRGGPANVKLLEEAVALRGQIAQALGFKNWAAYRTSTRMVKSDTAALGFLNDLKDKLAIRNRADFAQLLKFKKEIDPTATSIDQWDLTYLSTQLQKRDYSLDNEKIREYFPANTVVKGIFDVYSHLLGVNFVEVKNGSVWADNVKLYEIHNAKDCKLIGYFFTDLVPRAGKYGHAAAFTLISGRTLENGQYSLPISSIVANFTPPGADKPSLLTHGEVETFFHEFGHIMHQTLTRAPYATLAGSNVAQDFVEAPSQMLENWVWDKNILSRISGHYLRPDEKLPEDLLKKMLSAEKFQLSSGYTKQLLYALFDLTIHTQNGPVDVTKTFDDLYREIMGQEPIVGNHFAGTFGHMMGGYDAGYYGYLWSEVYAQDMFSKFPSDDLTDPVMGGRYRSIILEKGNMQDAIELLREFLGREPNAEAFFKKLGL
ncbi:MAG: Zn-dependent oligopeptidase [Bdellovibrionaceae bacterium]|nr:Zn-dependent oligopeptidase [Bdellovibrio sp.]